MANKNRRYWNGVCWIYPERDEQDRERMRAAYERKRVSNPLPGVLPDWPEWMGAHPRVCAPWTHMEEEVLRTGWAQGMTLPELAYKHGRAEGGITSRLCKILGAEAFYEQLRQRSAPPQPRQPDSVTIPAELANRIEQAQCVTCPRGVCMVRDHPEWTTPGWVCDGKRNLARMKGVGHEEG